uniref:Thymidylate kinase n=2 Tax=Equus caballus TaxID=9796 RepID=A0A9L0TJ79_HORSE
WVTGPPESARALDVPRTTATSLGASWTPRPSPTRRAPPSAKGLLTPRGPYLRVRSTDPPLPALPVSPNTSLSDWDSQAASDDGDNASALQVISRTERGEPVPTPPGNTIGPAPRPPAARAALPPSRALPRTAARAGHGAPGFRPGRGLCDQGVSSRPPAPSQPIRPTPENTGQSQRAPREPAHFSQSRRAPRAPAHSANPCARRGRPPISASAGQWELRVAQQRGQAADVAMAGRRGALIVLEGVDRAGKSTQSRRLVAALCDAGHRAELLSFPERSTDIGKLLSSYLEKKNEMENHSVHLLFSANRWEQVPLIKEKLSQGVTLIVDRYAFSGVAYTSAKADFSLDWCKQPDVGLPKPDLVVFLQLQLAEAAMRGEFGRERYENRTFQESVSQRFHQLMGDTTLNWKMVDASQSIEDVHKEIRELSEDTIQAAAQRPLGELWK